MAIRFLNTGYSSTVELYLVVNGYKLLVAQVGPDTLVLREPRYIPPSSEGELIIKIDGRTKIEHVMLPRGSTEDAVLVPFF